MKKIIIFMLFLFPSICFSVEMYQMKDLEALVKSKSWFELTQHLSDIAPSKRNTQWQKIVNVALSSRFEELSASGNSKDIFIFLEKTFPKYPTLKKNKNFMTLRGEFGLRYYESCFSYNDEACHKELLGFVDLDPNPLFALKIAKLVRRRMSDNKAIEYFELAMAKQAPKSSCDDSDLKLSLESALQAKPGSNYAKSAIKVAFGQCFDNLKKNMIVAVKNHDNAKNNACEKLLSQKALKGITKKKCIRFLKK